MPRHKTKVVNSKPCPECEHVPRNLVHHLMQNHGYSANRVAEWELNDGRIPQRAISTNQEI